VLITLCLHIYILDVRDRQYCLSVQVMFFFNNECLLIACNQSWPLACDAVPNKNEKFADAYYLRVRTTGELEISIDFVSCLIHSVVR